MIKAAFKYFFSAQNEHGLHSPFVFDLFRNIIKKDEVLPIFEEIEVIRQRMRLSCKILKIKDLGAGSLVNENKIREVRDVARNSEKSPRLGRLFFRLIQHFGYETIFDLGTSLGLTTLYLAANKNTSVTTFEGCPETAAVAQENFANSPNINIVVGNLDETLAEQITKIEKLDFAFFDANHRYEPTVSYFETCLSKAHENSLFIFDDIHWSPEMEAAWNYIQKHHSTTVTIDLFSVGLVFFRPQQPKQNFVLDWPFFRGYAFATKMLGPLRLFSEFV